MNMEMFAVFDAAAGIYMTPFAAPTITMALREFEKVAKTDGSQFNTYPEDYSLWHIGTFDQELGEITGQQAHKLALAITFRNIVPAQPVQLDIEDQIKEQA